MKGPRSKPNLTRQIVPDSFPSLDELDLPASMPSLAQWNVTLPTPSRTRIQEPRSTPSLGRFEVAVPIPPMGQFIPPISTPSLTRFQEPLSAPSLSQTVIQPTFVFAILDTFAPKQRSWLAIWVLLEACGFTAAAMLISHGLGAEQAGVISVFLAAASLSGRLSKLLDSNKRSYARGVRGWKTNPITAAGLLALFIGAFGAYATTAAILGEARVGTSFRFALQVAHLDSDSILSGRFGSVRSILAYNAQILVGIFILGFLYRAYGVMLTLCWNACIWGIVMVFLIRRGQHVSGAPALEFLVYSGAAVVPHLLLEALAYSECGLAALLLSLSIAKYPFSDRRLRRRLKAGAFLISASVITLLIAAVMEANLPPWLLQRYR